jgi:uncharacterized protein (TIGR02391 family)
MPNPYIVEVIKQYPTASALLALSPDDLQRVLLSCIAATCNDSMYRMVTRDALANGFHELGGYPYNVNEREEVQRAVGRAWKALELAGFIEEPDPDNGRNGFRIATEEGKRAVGEFDYGAAKMRSQFTRDMFHSSLPDAAWNAFRSGDYDTAVFEAFKAVEVAVRKKGRHASTDHGVALMKKAFDPGTGPLADKTAPLSRQNARRNLFMGAMGEIRNPKAHNDPSITDPPIAVEEMMAAGVLQRIVDGIP